MTLTTILPDLQRAVQAHYAVPLFNAFDLQSAEGIIQAAEDRRAPVIIGLYSGMLAQPNFRALAGYLRQRAAEATVPVALMLDHGASFEQCQQAILMGLTDVMLDASRLPFEENIAATQAVVRAAHAVGVSVEAELGHVGLGSDYQSIRSQRAGYTDPATVAEFVTRSGVDSLAIAIGNAHGQYQGEPHLELDLLAEIRAAVSIPLVLHGGSGISEQQFKAAVAAGIAKINIATDLYQTAGRAVAEACQAVPKPYLELLNLATASFADRCGYYLDLFGATGKAMPQGESAGGR